MDAAGLDAGAAEGDGGGGDAVPGEHAGGVAGGVRDEDAEVEAGVGVALGPDSVPTPNRSGGAP
jgi:hypothetical protein